MLTGKQKRYLRKKAHHLKAIFQVGKHGVNDEMIKQLKDVLEKREIIKISVLQNCLEDKHSIADQIVDLTGAELVQMIGNQIVLYKQSETNQTIHLPN